jgi:hypothetical protein
MQIRLIGCSLIIGLFGLLAAPVAESTGQVDGYGRVNEVPPSAHEVPAFVCDRVELIRDLAVAHPPGTIDPSGSEPVARDNAFAPGGRETTCACRDPKPGSALPNCPSGLPVM